jgi:hypothetical protein
MTYYGPIHLNGGGKYYIRALMAEHGGGDNLSVAWEGPDCPVRNVIDGYYLSPFKPYWAYGAYPPDDPYCDNPIDDRQPVLSWKSGIGVQPTNEHEVYFSANFADVNNRNPGIKVVRDEPNYPVPSVLSLGQTYYWAVDEVNTASLESPWKGNVWSFCISQCISVDNMEDYNSRTDLREVWKDGFSDTVWQTMPPWMLLQGGSSGSNLSVSTEVGSPVAPWRGPIHGGNQAMAMFYDNDNSTFPPIPGEEKWVYDTQGNLWSEIRAETTGPNSLDCGQDWTGENIKSFSLFFTGHPESLGKFVSYDAGPPVTYILDGYGRDFEGGHDEGFFMCLTLNGPGSIQARVASVEDTNPWAKAGVMIRNRLTPYSEHAAVYVTPGSGVSFQRREYAGGPTTNTTDANIAPPYWVRLERDMSNRFWAYRSTDGSFWTDFGASTWVQLDVNDPVYIGMAVTSHTDQEVCTAVFESLALDYSDPTWIYENIGTNDAEQLYIALEDTHNNVAVVEHNDVNAVIYTTWQPWPILLTEFSGVDLNSVKTVYIGVGERGNTTTAGGNGTVYIDDIRVCPPVCIPELEKPYADIAGKEGVGIFDCKVDEFDLQAMAADWLLSDDVIYTQAPNDANLHGHWAFEGNLNDSSTHGHHGSDPCASNPGYVAGVVGQALRLDGIDDWVYVGDVNISGAVPRTIAGWVKRNVLNIAAWTNIFGFTGPSGNNLHFDIEVVGDTATTTANYYGLHVYGTEWDLLAPDLDWHHFAATYDGTTAEGYADGILVFSNNHPGLNTPPNVQMGKRADNANHFPGDVDEVRIYSYALSDEEIAYLATNGGASIHIPLVSPAELYDSEPNGLKWINFRDHAIISGSWLDEVLWPSEE